VRHRMIPEPVSVMPPHASERALSPATPRPLAALLGWASRDRRGIVALLLTSAVLAGHVPALAAEDRPISCPNAAPRPLALASQKG
jgi:hypothetical protein